MAEVLLFHHAQGRTPGVEAFADELRAAGHTVHVPDLYDGHTFSELESGIGYAEQIGVDAVIQRGSRAAEGLSDGLVYAGISLGAMPAQKLTQTRPGAVGAFLVASCVPPSAFGAPWPAGVPVQVHGMDADPIFVEEGDLDAARNLVGSVDSAELFLYAGKGHLFIDNSLPGYDETATKLVLQRLLAFLS